MNKEADDPLVEYIKDAWRSLEVAPPIKIIKFEYTEEESKIDINRYIFKREKKKKKKDKVDYKFVQDSRYGSLTTWVQITLPVKNPTTNKVEIHRKLIKKSMLIPLRDDFGFYYIKGKKYYLIYQLVEKSTYTGNQTVTLKSLMPIALRRDTFEAEGMEMKDFESILTDTMTTDEDGFTKRVEVVVDDVDTNKYILPVYNVFMFRKEMPALLFYLANGVDWALNFLGVSEIISFEDDMNNRQKDEIWFQISSKCFLRVKDKELFNKYQYIQSVVGGILTIVSNRFTPSMIKDTSIWIKRLGNNKYSKGIDMLTFFNRLLDETTKKILLLDDYHKKDIYSLIRWMMMNFNDLRMKDNMNLYNKRIRCNEYISALLTIEFSKRLNRVISMGNKVTIDNYKEIFKFPGEILMQKLHISGVLRFDESINDMNFFSKFKITTKGPHSVGAKDSNRISIKARGIHPSYLENFDILVCGSSDPGSAALLSPWSRINGFYFDSTPEKDNFMYEFRNDLNDKDWKQKDDDGYDVIKINSDTKEKYFEVLNRLSEINSEITAYYPDDDSLLVIEDTEDIDVSTEKDEGDSTNKNEKDKS